jgi:beta-glucosidase
LAFGYGLSYTKFEYSDIKLSKNSIKANSGLTLEVSLRNAGSYDGDEVAQVYLTSYGSSVARPFRELKAFKRVRLKAGETRKLSFALGSRELGLYGEDLKWRVEPGRYSAAVGGSLDAALSVEFRVEAE